MAGVDIAKGKWVAVTLMGGELECLKVGENLRELFDSLPAVDVIGIDCPIGLPRFGDRRACDLAARECVGPRRNSVFLTTSSDLYACQDHPSALALASKKGWPGVSAQAWSLRDAIEEVALLARSRADVFEVHPEVSFRKAKGSDLPWSKKSWNGIEDRRQILAGRGLTAGGTFDGGGEAAVDDVLDASISAWSAWNIARGHGGVLPEGGDPIGTIRY